MDAGTPTRGWNPDDVVDAIAALQKKVENLLAERDIPLVLLTLGIALSGFAIWGRIDSQTIWSTGAFAALLGVSVLLMVLGCIERLIATQAKQRLIDTAMDKAAQERLVDERRQELRIAAREELQRVDPEAAALLSRAEARKELQDVDPDAAALLIRAEGGGQ